MRRERFPTSTYKQLDEPKNVSIEREVLNISGDQIEAAPSLGTNVDTHFILGMAKTESAVKILLDIDKVLSAEEIDALSHTG